MFTSVDKALVALIMAIIFLVNTLTGFHFALDEKTVDIIIGILLPILVHQIPNKQVQAAILSNTTQASGGTKLQCYVWVALLLALTLPLAACGLNPMQEALQTDNMYKVSTNASLACLKQTDCNKKAGAQIKAADSVAFGYDEQVVATAKAWDAASGDEKDAQLSIFDRINALAQSAITNLTQVLSSAGVSATSLPAPATP